MAPATTAGKKGADRPRSIREPARVSDRREEVKKAADAVQPDPPHRGGRAGRSPPAIARRALFFVCARAAKHRSLCSLSPYPPPAASARVFTAQCESRSGVAGETNALAVPVLFSLRHM